MNKVILMGRLVRDPDTRYGRGNDSTVISRYTLAVDRRYRKEDGQQADFIQCVAFGKAAEFADRYLCKGMRIAISGRLHTGSYTDREGRKVYTTDVIIEEQEFAQSKKEAGQQDPGGEPIGDGFMPIPDGVEDAGLPFD